MKQKKAMAEVSVINPIIHSVHKLVKRFKNLENLWKFRKFRNVEKKKINGILGWLKSSKALIMVGNSFLQVNLEISHK